MFFFLKNLIQTRKKNNKNADKKHISAVILKKVDRPITVIKKIKKAVFFILKKIHKAQIGTANTDKAVIPLS